MVGSDRGVGLSIVVFVAANAVSSKAVNTALYLARPGRDTVRLVTVVSVPSQRAEGQALLDDYARQALQLMLECHADVLVRGSSGLLDCMELYLEQRCPSDSTLVVMGSVQLTLNVFDSAMGSVAVALLRRLVGLPVIILTQNSRLSPGAPGASSPPSGSMRGSGAGAGSSLTVMVSVEPHARSLCQMVCSQLLSTKGRGDKLLLTQILPTHMTSQQQATSRRLLESFQAVCVSHRSPLDRCLLLNCPAGRAVDDVLLQSVEEQGAGLLAVQLPAGSKNLTKPLLKLLRGCKGAVLVYQEAVAGDGALLKRMAPAAAAAAAST